LIQVSLGPFSIAAFDPICVKFFIQLVLIQLLVLLKVTFPFGVILFVISLYVNFFNWWFWLPFWDWSTWLCNYDRLFNYFYIVLWFGDNLFGNFT